MLRKQKSFGASPVPGGAKTGNNFASLTNWLNQTESFGTLNVGEDTSYLPVRSVSNLGDPRTDYAMHTNSPIPIIQHHHHFINNNRHHHHHSYHEVTIPRHPIVCSKHVNILKRQNNFIHPVVSQQSLETPAANKQKQPESRAISQKIPVKPRKPLRRLLIV